MVAWFREHQRRWLNGEIALVDYCEARLEDGTPLWYPPDMLLGGHHEPRQPVIPKDAFFEKIEYRPSEPACRFHASLAHIKYFGGGARAGKSLTGSCEVLPLLLTPGTQIWLVGPEYYNTVKEFRYIADYTVNHPIVGRTVKPFVARYVDRPDGGDMEIRFKWGGGLPDSWVRCKSARTLSTLLSEELDCIVMCEAALIKEEVWENKLRMRLVDRNGLALFPTSPAGTGWTKELYEKGLDGEPGHFSISADSRTNPVQSLSSVAFWSKNMDHADFEEQVRGRPTPKHGLVYPEFDHDLHVRSWRRQWPMPSWHRVRGVDFGYQCPFVVLWVAFDEDKRAYVYHEFYRTQQLIDQVATAVAKYEGREFTRCGRTGRIRVSQATAKKQPKVAITDWEAQQRAELTARGIKCRRANKDLLAGIETVSSFLQVQDDGRPRLFISPACRMLIHELRNWEWSKDESDKPCEGQDHALDALRYVLHTLHGKQVHSRRISVISRRS